MTSAAAINWDEEFCERTGPVKVTTIDRNGHTAKITFPVYNGEIGKDQICTLELGFAMEDGEAVLHNF